MLFSPRELYFDEYVLVIGTELRYRHLQSVSAAHMYINTFMMMLYFLQGDIEVESENVFKLAANALQVSFLFAWELYCILIGHSKAYIF